MSELLTRERIILAIDTSEQQEAKRLSGIAKEAGARFVKLGLELSSATSWNYCSELAAEYGLEWVADAKLDDIPDTVLGAINNIKKLEHPPFGITMHVKAGNEAMRLAQEAAGDMLILGVTELTSIPPQETQQRYDVSRSTFVGRLTREAAEAGLKGIVASSEEVGVIKRQNETKHLFAMIPGTRSASAEHHDQANVGTPAAAIHDGADLLVIGRQITKATFPGRAYDDIITEISEYL